MTRVCLKNNPDITGTIIRDGRREGEVVVQWDDSEEYDGRWTIGRDRLVLIDAEGKTLLAEQLTATLERLRDAFNLAIGAAIEDIKRETK